MLSSVNHEKDLVEWLNDNKLEWTNNVFGESAEKVLSLWNCDNFGYQLLDCSNEAQLEYLGFSSQKFNLKEILMSLTSLRQNNLDMGLVIDTEKDQSRAADDYFIAPGDFSSGGFHISSVGIEAVPEPSTCCPEFILQEEVPRHTKSSTILMNSIGKGGSSEVTMGLYVPTLTMVAVKTVWVESPSIRKQMLTELKALYSLSKYPLKAYECAHCIPNHKAQIAKLQFDLQPDFSYYSRTLTFFKFLFSIGLVFKLILDISTSIRPVTTLFFGIALCFLLFTEEILDAVMNTFSIDYFDSETTTIDKNICTINDKAFELKMNSNMSPTADTMKEYEDKELTLCPYIIRFYDAFMNPDDKTVSIVLEYMDGGSLQTLLNKNEAFDDDNIVKIAYSVLQALIHIHHYKIIHRDIKPGNILFDHNGHIKLSDFGIVRDMSDQKTSTNTFTGTISYMSPERLLGSKYSYKSDIWSFGITMRSLIQPRTLNSENSEQTYWSLTANQHIEYSDYSNRKKCLIDFINQCLQQDPHSRPDAKDLINHPFITEAIQRGEIISGKAPSLSNIHARMLTENQIEEIISKTFEWSIENMSSDDPKKLLRSVLRSNKSEERRPLNVELFIQLSTSRFYGKRQIAWFAHQIQCDEEKVRSMFLSKICSVDNITFIAIKKLHEYLIETSNDKCEKEYRLFKISLKHSIDDLTWNDNNNFDARIMQSITNITKQLIEKSFNYSLCNRHITEILFEQYSLGKSTVRKNISTTKPYNSLVGLARINSDGKQSLQATPITFQDKVDSGWRNKLSLDSVDDISSSDKSQPDTAIIVDPRASKSFSRDNFDHHGCLNESTVNSAEREIKLSPLPSPLVFELKTKIFPEKSQAIYIKKAESLTIKDLPNELNCNRLHRIKANPSIFVSTDETSEEANFRINNKNERKINDGCMNTKFVTKTVNEETKEANLYCTDGVDKY